MLYALLVGIVLAGSVFVGAHFVSNAYIKNDYLSEQSRVAREQDYYQNLQRFVDRYGLESSDTDRLAEWVRDNRYLYVMIYKDDQLLLDSDTADKQPEKPTDENNGDPGEGEGEAPPPTEGDDGTIEPPQDEEPSDKPTDEENGEKEDDEEGSGVGSGITVTFPSREELIEYAKSRGTYPIEMADDVPLLVSLVDYTEYLYYDILNIVSLLLAALVLILTIMLYFRGITGRITRLGKEVSRVAAGDVNHSVIHKKADGSDEISTLMRNVENMRRTMLESLENEREALESNTELITSMSHDIRTPLTVLLGYIDLMKLNTEDPKLREYLSASESTAMRLKQMSDDTFGYFLLFGEGKQSADIEPYDIPMLFEQILSEKILLLREQGYTVEIDSLASKSSAYYSVQVLTDAPKLMRIAENIFSNVTKYADKEKVVTVSTSVDENRLTVEITNFISKTADDAESNGIGLKTCRKLAELLGMGFSAEDDGELYRVVLDMPVKRKKNDKNT